jgi:anaerobic magnesium-protoporphyrin IX monomethyl ester cyclase
VQLSYQPQAKDLSPICQVSAKSQRPIGWQALVQIVLAKKQQKFDNLLTTGFPCQPRTLVCSAQAGSCGAAERDGARSPRGESNVAWKSADVPTTDERGLTSVADVLLTHSYHLHYDRKQTRKMQPYPPLGTLYAAALLRSTGVSVAVFDTMLNDPEQGFQAALEQHRPRVVVVYEDNFNFLSKMCLTRMREVAYHILETSLRAGATVLVNGSDASDHAVDYLQKGFRCVLLGEAEWTLLEVVQGLLKGDEHALAHVPGLAYLQDGTGELVRTARRPLMRDLDLLPFPARDLVDTEQYRDAWKAAHGYFSLNIVSSRGCPYRCNWCAKPIYGDSFAVRSPQSVAEEMRRLKYDLGAEHLWFADDIFGLRAKWVREFALEVEELDAAVPFKMQSRVDLMTVDTVRALRKAGCAEVWMGAESGSQRILDAMDKGTRIEQIAMARENLRNEGIRACYFLQFGYPGETWEDIQKTADLVRSTHPDDIGVSVSYPLPGTKFFDRVHAQLGEKTNWSDSEDLSMMFQGAYTDKFYRALHDALHAQVDSWNSSGRVGTHNQLGKDSDPNELWERVVRLEETCRSPRPTVLDSTAGGKFVQLEATSSPASFDDLVSILGS